MAARRPDDEGGDTPDRPSSPVCYANESGDLYAGYADREELIAFCNMLLEAERAGARAAAHTAKEASDAELSALMEDIRRDEAHWCAMLVRWIAALGGEASPRTGDFYEKCLAIADLPARAFFINRGQDWVARKLRAMMPRIRDDRMHADLAAMLDGHEANIAKTGEVLRCDAITR